MGVDEGTEKHRLYRCPVWRELRNQIPGIGEEGAHYVVSSSREWLEAEPVVGQKMIVREAQKLAHASRRVFVTVSPPMAPRWDRQVECM